MWYNGGKEILTLRNKKMENSNEILPTPQPNQLPEQPKNWYQHKGLIAIFVLAVIAAVAIWVYFILNQPQVVSPVVVKHKQYLAALQDNAVATSVPESVVQTIRVNSPIDWGVIQNIQQYSPEIDPNKPSPSRAKVSDAYEISYPNNITAVFEQGRNLFYWSRGTGTDVCQNYEKNIEKLISGTDFKIGATCNTYEQGFYLFSNKQSVLISTENTGFDAAPVIELSTLFIADQKGNLTPMLFSPNGTYAFIKNLCPGEYGCGVDYITMVNASDGSIAMEGMYEYSVVNFSSDETSFIWRAVTDGYRNYPAFLFVNPANKRYVTIQLEGLFSESTTYGDGSPDNVVSNVLITGLTNNGMNFTLIKGLTDGNPAGNYYYDFSSQKITPQNVQ